MSFDVYTKTGLHFIVWFDSIEQLIASMKMNPEDVYHRKN
jgi:hypothetical protein